MHPKPPRFIVSHDWEPVFNLLDHLVAYAVCIVVIGAVLWLCLQQAAQ